jgi:hypothetical protein
MAEPSTGAVALPLIDEGNPGLGRLSNLREEERRQSGNVPDDPPDNPVRDDMPFRITSK